MKQFILSVFLTVAGISAAQADGCKAEEIEPLLTKFFATTWSKDCEAQLKAMDVDEVWLAECRKVQNSLQATFLMEMNRRTHSTFKELRSKEGRDYAIIEITGPEWTTFSTELMGASVEGDCAVKNTLLSTQAERVCGEAFWSTIPISTRSGAVPLKCHAGKWRIVGFD